MLSNYLIRSLSSVGSERLPYKQRVGGSNPSATTAFAYMVDIVQLVRASDCGSECRGFEPHFPPIISSGFKQEILKD